ncbi:MAG: hypothetical protein MUD12_03355 [Spirochaetes bacterium]|jgi:hypothetical protein|nr:hypothetical protein [Spirochaetota bacterium]
MSRKSIIVIIFSIPLALLILAEMSLQVLAGISPEKQYFGFEYNKYRPAPRSGRFGFRLNSSGFNDTEHRKEKKPGTFRIVAAGDSIFFSAVPYGKCSLSVTEGLFNKSGKKTEIINMGIPSIGQKDILALLLNEGLAYRPDMVIITFFIGDDFSGSRIKRILSKFRTPFLADHIRGILVKTETIPSSGIENYDDKRPTFPEDYYHQILKKRMKLFWKKSGFLKENFEWCTDFLVNAKRTCDRLGIPFMVVIAPEEMQADRPLSERIAFLLRMSTDECDFSLPNRMLHEKLGRYGIRYVDLLPILEKKIREGETLYKPLDTHWNIMGNLLVGTAMHDAISAYLRDLKK